MQVINTGITEQGNTYTEEFYTDPEPGRKGTDIITEDCGACGGTGLYAAPSGLKIYTATVGGSDKGCFQCWGTGKRSRKVSSIRAAEHRRVKAANQRAAEAADYEANREAREAQELLDSLEEAYAENDRRNSLPEGFWAEEGETVEVTAKVVTSKTYEGFNYYGAPELKGLVVFANEAGQPAIYFTTWKNADKFEEGKDYSIKATVKRHGKDRNDEVDQTTLTRVTIKK